MDFKLWAPGPIPSQIGRVEICHFWVGLGSMPPPKWPSTERYLRIRPTSRTPKRGGRACFGPLKTISIQGIFEKNSYIFEKIFKIFSIFFNYFLECSKKTLVNTLNSLLKTTHFENKFYLTKKFKKYISNQNFIIFVK